MNVVFIRSNDPIIITHIILNDELDKVFLL